MSPVELSQLASALIVAVLGSAGWGYLKDRRKSKAEGDVATATVEIQVEAHRVQGLEQRLALSEKAWDAERASFERRIHHLEEELADERRERAEEKTLHEEKVGLLEQRLRVMQRELADLTEEISHLKKPS